MKIPVSSIALTLSAAGFLTLSCESAIAELPMKISAVEEMYVLTVPDQDTTKSAYGGKLRRYDVHIARMFEVTQQICIATENSVGDVLWRYTAGNGAIDMGTFKITCEDADGAAMMLGTGSPQTVNVNHSTDSSARKKSLIQIFPLDLSTNANVSRWQTITRSFKPIR